MLITAVFAGILSLPCPVRADDITFRAEIDRNSVSIEDTLTLRLIIAGGHLSAAQPTLPPISGFKVYSSGQSQNVSFVNGAISTRIVFSYSLVPQAPGRYTIPSLVLNVGGQSLTSDPITVEVRPAGTSSPKGAALPPAPRETTRRDLFITTELDKTSAYVGEPLTLTFRFYSRARLVSQPSYHPPETTGFLKEDLPPQRNFMTELDGQAYSVVELKTALFPTAPGRFTVGPASLECRVQDFSADPLFSDNPFDSFFDDFFSGGKTVTLRSDPITVDVRRLPDAGRPDHFKGDVGRYTVSASLDKREVQLHEPVTLTVTVSGDGNIKSLSQPEWPPLNGFRAYETLSSLNIEKEGYRVKGSKVFKTILKPDVTGELNIPPVEFAYFDPRAESYRSVKTSDLSLRVLPGPAGAEEAGPIFNPEGVKVVGQDIRFIKIRADLNPRQTPFHQRKIFWFFHLIPPLVYFGLWGFRFYRTRLNADPARRRFRGAARMAEKHLRQALAALEKNDLAVCYENLHRSLLEYLGGKTGGAPHGLRWESVSEKFAAAGISPERTNEIRALWDELDRSRYAPTDLTPEGAQKHAVRLTEIIRHLEKAWKSVGSPARILLPALILLGALVGARAENSAERLFDQANQAYREGSFSAALDAYERIVAEGLGGPELYYNLGNAYYRLGELGEARLWYERALLEEPRDEDIRHNLSLIRSQVHESEQENWRLWLDTSWPWLAWGTIILHFLFFGLLAAGLYGETEEMWWARWGCGLALGAAVVALLALAPQRARHYGVVVEPRVEARTGPGEEYPAGFVVPEGRKVVFFDSKFGWSQIGVADQGLKGWAPKDAVESIDIDRPE